MNQLRPAILRVSKCTIKARHIVEESQQPWYLTASEVQLLPLGYMETGLLFYKPEHIPIQTILDQLKDSLSTALTLFYPLYGRLITKKNLNPPSYSVFVDCKDDPGVEFVHAVADATTVSDILSPTYVPRLVESLFALDRPIGHDGHNLPNLAVQVTELDDGYFVGCSCNHVLVDGRSFWHFFNVWSEISRSKEQSIQCISRPPVTKRWFNNEQYCISHLPVSQPEEFTTPEQPYVERIFHFSSQSVQKLKAKANADLCTDKISSFQALASLAWRAITRARGLLIDQKTTCLFSVDMRLRLEQSLPTDYFGSVVTCPCVTTKAGDLLKNSLGWCASLLHKKISEHNNIKDPVLVLTHDQLADPDTVMFGMSPRFDTYTNDFGWGAPIAVRSGNMLKFNGVVNLYPGREGGGSIDLEICLFRKSMNALEMDEEFMNMVSPICT